MAVAFLKDWTKGPCTFPNGANTGEARCGRWSVVGLWSTTSTTTSLHNYYCAVRVQYYSARGVIQHRYIVLYIPCIYCTLHTALKPRLPCRTFVHSTRTRRASLRALRCSRHGDGPLSLLPAAYIQAPFGSQSLTRSIQPPRRRPQTAAAAAASSSSAAAANKVPPKKRASKLAKENDITADQEAEIQEAFALFALHHVADYEDEKEGVIRAQDVRRCLMYASSLPFPCSLLLFHNTRSPGPPPSLGVHA